MTAREGAKHLRVAHAAGSESSHQRGFTEEEFEEFFDCGASVESGSFLKTPAASSVKDEAPPRASNPIKENAIFPGKSLIDFKMKFGS